MKIFVIFLIFICLVFGISMGAVSDDQVRKKRLVSTLPEGNPIVSIQEVGYIVNILKNGLNWCGGAILSPRVVLSVAHCFMEEAYYIILSGVNQSQVHTIENIARYPGFNPSDPFKDDLAILHIKNPPFILNKSPNREIELHDGHVPPNAVGTLSGWGCTNESGQDVYDNRELRSMQIPIVSDCTKLINRFIKITEKEFCTHDASGEKFSGFGDSGGPFVVNEKLLGVLSFTSKLELADVYMKVSYGPYKEWIESHILRSVLPNVTHSPLQQSRSRQSPLRQWFRKFMKKM